MIDLKPCPFCGAAPELPDGFGSQYDIWCGECGNACVSVQISDLMTREERHLPDVWDDKHYKYAQPFVDRARQEAASRWNARSETARLEGRVAELEATIRASIESYDSGNHEHAQAVLLLSEIQVEDATTCRALQQQGEG